MNEATKNFLNTAITQLAVPTALTYFTAQHIKSWYDNNKHEPANNGLILACLLAVVSMPAVVFAGAAVMNPLSITILAKNTFGWVSESPAVECVKAAALCGASSYAQKNKCNYITSAAFGIAAALTVGKVAESLSR